ncbi:hypothetical protein [Photobacterium swingsii]|uniref:hypothetical protein n=1 Tax=Photobacterium swingsii TaxID=680026 RepID=UPI004068519D
MINNCFLFKGRESALCAIRNIEIERNNYMHRYVYVLLLTVFITACGGGDDHSAQDKVSKPPKATNVALDGIEQGELLQSGQEAIGQYTFNSTSVPPGLDASIGYWETESGMSIHRGFKYRIPNDNSLAGIRIRFCVIPFNRADRKAGEKACSKYFLVSASYFDDMLPAVRILSNAYTPEEVGFELLTYVVDKNGEPSNNKFGFRWLRNGQIIQNENRDSYWLTVADEGKHISVCIIDLATETLISCSEETNAINAAIGTEPFVMIQPLPAKAEQGKTLFLDYEFVDFENDKEDINMTSFAWLLDGQRVSPNQSLIIDNSMVGKKIQGCVTPYALTGWPKAGEQTCTEEVVVQPLSDDTPHALNLAIAGHRFEGYVLEGVYDYFDSNKVPENQSIYTWSIIHDGQEKEVSTEQHYKLQAGDEGEGNKVRFCVTPRNSHTQGAATCVTENIAWIDGEGELKEGGKVTANLNGFPAFNLSYWLSANESETLPFAISTVPNTILAFDVEATLPESFNLRPMRLCVSFDDKFLNDDDICRELPVNGKLTRSLILKDEQGDHAAINLNQVITIDSIYRLHRPATWAEFSSLPLEMKEKFHSAEASHLPDSDLRGLQMTPQDADKFCRLKFGKPGVASSYLYRRYGMGENYSWPAELVAQEFVTKELNDFFVVRDGNLVAADSNKKYAFTCVSMY